jgi:ketosteroid isomerase-like protein
MTAADRNARLRTARLSPEIANRHDEAAWLALYTDDAVVEDPFGTPACRRGARTRGGRDDLERFYAAFIAPTSIRVEERLDVVVRDTVVRDVVLHVKLPGGGRASIPAFLEYDLDASSDALRVRRMRAYWDARRNGRAMMAQGVRGKLTSLLSAVRLLRHFGRDWTRRYVDGTRRGVRRDGPAIVRALVSALAGGDRAALDAVITNDATIVLPGLAPRPLSDAGALKLEVDEPICAGFTCVARCRTRAPAGELEGVAFVEVDPSSKRVACLRLLWEG